MTTIQCHYDVLGVERDADAATIKKRHRKMALKLHPDKNIGDDTAAEKFRLVQQAYECLSDPQERKWYDEHRDAILAGWSSSSGADQNDLNMLFDVVHFMHAGCFNGFHDDKGGFYDIYRTAFSDIVQCELRQSDVVIELPTDFGTPDTDWSEVAAFYQHWESFSTALNFAWEDKYNTQEDAPDRRIRRLMEDDNRKARKIAKKAYNKDIVALVSFVKRRDPRVQRKRAELEREKSAKQQRMKEQANQRKADQRKAKDVWLEQNRLDMEALEEEDQQAGRIRLADLDEDYDYGGGKKKKKRGKKKNRAAAHDGDEYAKDDNDDNDIGVVENKSQSGDDDVMDDVDDVNDDTSASASGPMNDENDQHEADVIANEQIQHDGNDPQQSEPADGINENDDDNILLSEKGDPPLLPDGNEDDYDSESEESESSEEPEIWRCVCCKKDFKSEGQMNNHMKSKKHKEKFKKYQAAMKKKEEATMNDMMDEMMLNP
eukprot:CAMPEP_0119563376 /NCGR_PEP_ID=MMETSP1352-20130426/23182_1 /TAXON_ID=265584 /ORGANISM="Stauroneis constricta, Strain CCMP1120" /LENGTH=488 /DNA_ID=CAMNT_0007611957 /DNA_START=83 /DNA_END=1549 /DNA_ORIENTATION=+